MINSKDFPIEVDEEIKLGLAKIEDTEELFKIVDENRGYLAKWLSWVPGWTIENQQEAIRQESRILSEGSGIALNIRYCGELVGRIGVHSMYLPYRRAEIAYWLAQPAIGNGVMTRSCRALVDYLFGTLKLHRIEIRCIPENTRSSAIPKRLGFTYEGTLKEASLINGRYVDQEVYRLLEQEWRT